MIKNLYTKAGVATSMAVMSLGAFAETPPPAPDYPLFNQTHLDSLKAPITDSGVVTWVVALGGIAIGLGILGFLIAKAQRIFAKPTN